MPGRILCALFVGFAGLGGHALAAEELPPIPPIKRLLPPPGIEIPAEVRQELEAKLAELEPRIEKLTDAEHRPDVEVFSKAVRFALRFGEFYDQRDFDKARWALQQAEERLALAEQGQSPWTKQTGLVVRGYRSRIDNSVQPYGVVIPKDHDFAKPCPLYVWLHGRGDKQTDLHFLHERAHKVGEIAPPGAIVVHPFGRHCLGFKSAGEIDVLHVKHEATRSYETTGETILIGFSMGGAGAWHIGAHFPDEWCAVAPGAGFAETARYQKLRPENFPPAYEQTLWGMYDVPNYVRNLFNVRVIAYSGENDKQIQAAQIMEEAFKLEGRKLTHLIGPGVEHKYHPDTKQELLRRLEAIASETYEFPTKIAFQTRTLSYSDAYWLRVDGLERHWQDSRVDVQQDEFGIAMNTKNVTALSMEVLDWSDSREPVTVHIDGQKVLAPQLFRPGPFINLLRKDDKWVGVDDDQMHVALKSRKNRLACGPIDDVFRRPFIFVVPDAPSRHARVQQWVDFELAHAIERWQAAFRGMPRIKKFRDLTDDDLQRYSLVMFGDPASNQGIAKVLEQLPLAWNDKELTFDGKTYDAATHVPLMIRPSPYGQANYIVLNCGPTFREAHDRTNSLQNPKLPDWAIVDITTPPDGEKPGKIVAADFFDEEWQVKQASGMR